MRIMIMVCFLSHCFRLFPGNRSRELQRFRAPAAVLALAVRQASLSPATTTSTIIIVVTGAGAPRECVAGPKLGQRRQPKQLQHQVTLVLVLFCCLACCAAPKAALQFLDSSCELGARRLENWRL